MFLELYFKGGVVTVGNPKIEQNLPLLLTNKRNNFSEKVNTLYEQHKFFKFNNKYWSSRKYWNFFCWFFYYKHRQVTDVELPVKITQLVFWDMLALYKAWRHLKGYPVNGQRTWSNGKSCTKNNVTLKQYRLKQFQQNFGVKRKISYVMLIQAEATNRLWLKTWPAEWLQGHYHAIKSKSRKGFTIPIDLTNLANSITTGYLRKGQAEKWNKSKKALKTVTIGLPVFFSRFFFSNSKKKHFKYQLTLLQPAQHRAIKKKNQKKQPSNLTKKIKKK